MGPPSHCKLVVDQTAPRLTIFCLSIDRFAPCNAFERGNPSPEVTSNASFC